MIEPIWFLYGAVLPAAVCAALVLLTTRWLNPRQEIGRALGWVVGVTAGVLIGQLTTEGLPPIPPVESHDWLIWVVVPVVGLVALISLLPAVPRWLVWALGMVVAGGVPPILLQSYIQYTWSGADALAWLAGLGLGIVGLWLLLRLFPPPRLAGADAWWWPVAAVILAAGTGMVILFSGSMTLGKIGLTLAAVFAGGFVASVFVRRKVSVFLDTGLVVVPLAGLCLNGYFYASMDPVDALLLTAATVSWLFVELPGLRRLGSLKSAVLRVAVVTLVVAIPVVRAGLRFMHEFNEPAYY